MANPMNPLTNPYNIYYVPLGSAVTLVNPPLIETNNHLRARAMHLALFSKNKLRFAYRSILRVELGDPL